MITLQKIWHNDIEALLLFDTKKRHKKFLVKWIFDSNKFVDGQWVIGKNIFVHKTTVTPDLQYLLYQ